MIPTFIKKIFATQPPPAPASPISPIATAHAAPPVTTATPPPPAPPVAYQAVVQRDEMIDGQGRIVGYRFKVSPSCQGTTLTPPQIA